MALLVKKTAAPNVKQESMRDQRFIAAHRCGLLDKESHAFLARWAADCAEQVLHYFTCCSDDPRPKDALEIGRKWANGEVKTGVAMKASVAAHAAARLVKDQAAIAAARAAAHAVAAAHFADHSMGALIYSMKAWEASGISADAAFQLQIAKLPAHLKEPVSSGVALRFKRHGSSRMKSDI